MRSVFFDPGQMTARSTWRRRKKRRTGRVARPYLCRNCFHVGALIEPVSEVREERAGADVFTLTHRIWLRFRSDIRAGMRLRKGDRLFAIGTWRDPDETGRYVCCLCEEEVR